MIPAPTLIPKEPVFLPAEDRTRMARLYEEVWIRLEEMAMITSRTLKLDAGRESEIGFRHFAQEPKFDYDAVELVRTSRGAGCYDYRHGLCFEPGSHHQLGDVDSTVRS